MTGTPGCRDLQTRLLKRVSLFPAKTKRSTNKSWQRKQHKQPARTGGRDSIKNQTPRRNNVTTFWFGLFSMIVKCHRLLFKTFLINSLHFIKLQLYSNRVFIKHAAKEH